MRAEFSELCTEHGLGEAKASQLKAALEMGRRLGMLQDDEKYQIKSPADAANLVIAEFTYLECMELNGLPSTVNSAEISQGIFLKESCSRRFNIRGERNHNSVEKPKKTVYNAPQRKRCAPGCPRSKPVLLFA
jgi:hypothetical protein